MASSINASTSAGVVTTADTSGVLNIQTAGTTAITVDASQRVGIGTASPATKLNVSSAGADVEVRASTTVSGNVRFGFDADGAYYNWIQTNRSSGALQFAISNSEVMQISAGGNLGIGTTAPQNKLQVATTTRPQFSVSYNGTTGLYLEDSTASVGKSWKIATSTAVASALEFFQSTATSGVPVWAANPTMTLNTNGVLVLQGGSTAANGIGITFPATQSASSNANTLDDYEEGTWNLTIAGVAPASYTAYYVKVGRTVTINVDVTSASTGATISLPFTVATGYHGALAVGWQTVAAAKTIYVQNGQVNAVLIAAGTGNTSNITSGERIIYGGSYVTD
jgi:hypothetical protein